MPLEGKKKKRKRNPSLALTMKYLNAFSPYFISLINRPKCHASIKLQDLITKAVLVCEASLISYTAINVTVEEFLTLHKSTFVR